MQARLKALHTSRRESESDIFARPLHPREPIPSEPKQPNSLRRMQPYRSRTPLAGPDPRPKACLSRSGSDRALPGLFRVSEAAFPDWSRCLLPALLRDVVERSAVTF